MRKPLVLSWVGKSYHEEERNQLFGMLGDTWRSSGGGGSAFGGPLAGALFSSAAVANQTDWAGGSIYVDGSLPAPAPDRHARLEAAHEQCLRRHALRCRWPGTAHGALRSG